MTRVDACNAVGRHVEAKRDRVRFAELTVRPPHFPHAEAYQCDGEGGMLWLRNCAECGTTLSMPTTNEGGAQ